MFDPEVLVGKQDLTGEAKECQCACGCGEGAAGSGSGSGSGGDPDKPSG